MAGVHMQREMDKIKKELLSLGAMVEDRLKQAILAIRTGDLELAKSIIKTDQEVDEQEVELEENCLKVLALYQPVASDLRFLVAVIKINNDLERIADYAVNISQRFQASFQDVQRFKYDYTEMATLTSKMLKLSLDALVRWDVDMAYDVREMDSKVNEMRNDAYDTMKKDIQAHPEMVGKIINMYLISRHLERVGDHSTNIAEEVIYLIEGAIIRHQK